MEPDEVTAVLDDPVAQELLASTVPARFAYTARDGTPRVVPVGVYWDGSRILSATPTNAPKLPALRANPSVALTIDTNVPPQKVLLMRSRVDIEIVDGVPDSYIAGARKYVTHGDKDEAWLTEFEQGVRALYDQMALLTTTATWAKIFDFETRIPSPVEELARQKFGPPGQS